MLIYLFIQDQSPSYISLLKYSKPWLAFYEMKTKTKKYEFPNTFVFMALVCLRCVAMKLLN